MTEYMNRYTNYTPTQIELDTIKQTSKDVYVTIELLNKDLSIISSMHGSLISDNLSVNCDSKQRRSYTCQLHVTDSSLLLGEDKKIWIDKYIRVYYGIQSYRAKKTLWWLIGTFSYIDANYTWSETENSLSLSCADIMADYDGTKNGQMLGYSLTIPAGEDIRQSIIALLKDAGIKKYIVNDIGKEIPYDLEFSDTMTYCDVWEEICGLYDSWEFFFDVHGTFIWRQIPTGLDEQCIMDSTILDRLFIDENVNYSFKGIYNVTEIWGKVLELEYDDRFAESSTYKDGIYSINVDGITSLDDMDHLDRIAITICTTSPASPKVSINGLEAIPIVNDAGQELVAGRMSANTTYVFSYRRNMGDAIQNCLYLLGQYQAHGIYREMNHDCPFSVPNLGYEIVNRKNYDNLYSDDLCYNQAEYLTYQTTAMRDTITADFILIPWMDVNRKIEYTSKTTGKTDQYIIKSFSWSTLDGTMSIVLYRFLESFSYVKNRTRAYRGGF